MPFAVLVVGGGPVGLGFAAILAKPSRSVAVIGLYPVEALEYRPNKGPKDGLQEDGGVDLEADRNLGLFPA